MVSKRMKQTYLAYWIPNVVADIMAEAVDDDESTLPDLDPGNQLNSCFISATQFCNARYS